MRDGSHQTVLPQAGQKWNVTGKPLSEARCHSVDWPDTATAWIGKNAAMPNGPPVRRWHSRQWHSETETGSPAHMTRRSPQEQVAVRVNAIPPA